MTITRIIGGVPQEFTLSRQEMCDAFYEQQAIFDRQDVEDELNEFSDEDLDYFYGLNRETICSLVDDMAERMRTYMWKYDMDFYSARDEAIKDEVDHYKDIHGIC